MSERIPPAIAAKRRADGDDESSKRDQWKDRRRRVDRYSSIVSLLFIAAIIAAVGLFVIYVTGGQTQIEGVLLFLAFGALGVGIAVWAKVIIAEPQVVEDRDPLGGHVEERQSFSDAFSTALGEGRTGGRRRFLLRLLGIAGGAIAAAVFIPLRSLGPGPKSELFRTSWGTGRRLVDLEGQPVRPEDIVDDQVVTVFPEGAVGSADSQAVLIGLRSDRDTELPQPSVNGMACYSKVCTHAGCPVGLYRARAGELICPCHQSTFDVYHGAKPVAGPAARALPQLPIDVDADGFLVAMGDFPEPIGPSFWNMTDNVEEQS